MWPDRVSNPGPLTCESGALPIALRGPAAAVEIGALRVNEPYSTYSVISSIKPLSHCGHVKS